MNGFQLYAILKRHHHTRDVFDSVLPADLMPRDVGHFPSMFVVNQDPHMKDGSHWCAICFPAKNKAAEFFDSRAHGLDAYPSEMVLSLQSNGNGRIKTNPHPYQLPESSTCGNFCLWFLDQRCMGLNFENCMKLLSNQALERNERIVTRYTDLHMTSA